MKPTPFTEMATAFRGHIVRLWALQQPGTAAENSFALTEAAIKFGYVSRSRPVPGAALKSWISDPATTPLWAAQTSLTLMLSYGWTPESRQDWCGFAALFFKEYKHLSIDELLKIVPSHIDTKRAEGWLVAAIEEEANFRALRKRK